MIHTTSPLFFFSIGNQGEHQVYSAGILHRVETLARQETEMGNGAQNETRTNRVLALLLTDRALAVGIPSA